MWFAVTYLWGINLLALLAFGWDASRARRRRRRISERRMLWLAVLGGSPGALLGGWIFRHKTRKRGLRAWLLVIAAAQAGLGYVLLSGTVAWS